MDRILKFGFVICLYMNVIFSSNDTFLNQGLLDKENIEVSLEMTTVTSLEAQPLQQSQPTTNIFADSLYKISQQYLQFLNAQEKLYLFFAFYYNYNSEIVSRIDDFTNDFQRLLSKRVLFERDGNSQILLRRDREFYNELEKICFQIPEEYKVILRELKILVDEDKINNFCLVVGDRRCPFRKIYANLWIAEDTLNNDFFISHRNFKSLLIWAKIPLHLGPEYEKVIFEALNEKKGCFTVRYFLTKISFLPFIKCISKLSEYQRRFVVRILIHALSFYLTLSIDIGSYVPKTPLMLSFFGPTFLFFTLFFLIFRIYRFITPNIFNKFLMSHGYDDTGFNFDMFNYKVEPPCIQKKLRSVLPYFIPAKPFNEGILMLEKVCFALFVLVFLFVVLLPDFIHYVNSLERN